MSEGAEARRYLRQHRAGMLATLSQRLGGYPFGSVTPFVTDHQARPVILVSRLAEHTKNLEADPRASLLVHDTSGDVQAGARLTLVANATPLPDDPPLTGRYLRYFPGAENLLALGDFSFYALEPVFVRHIAGFGAIRSIAPQSFAPPPNRLAEAEQEIVVHMNDAHGEALRAYCRAEDGTVPVEVAMLGIDCDGFDVRADGAIRRFEFDAPVTSDCQARTTLAAMARTARA